ncbi:dipeptidase [Anaerotruncus rubiinfantis]|uniref:dipeptidase n=1 Tax=Anaerotruncus rubiinfantis TaxID=1720200 RepID=UPI0008363D95|nr:membrane dipeptidase [Anaerotruncus rubiinfantis]
MEQDIVRIAQDAIMTYYSTDDPENKAYALAVNAQVSDEARRIHKESTIIDMCSFYLEADNWHLRESGVTALNLTVPGVFDGMEQALSNMIYHYEVIKNSPNLFALMERPDDIRNAKKAGKIGVIIGAQSCRFIEHADLESACEVFAKVGLRVMQIGYNMRTFAADGCLSGTDAPLSREGKVLIKAMEKAGITVDLSHIGARSSLDAIEACEKPPIFSHSNPLELFKHPRNITAEQAKKCAAKGGVIGVCSYVPILWDEKHHPSIENFVDAISYYADLVGIDHVGIGIDSNAEPAAYDRHDTRHLMQLVSPNREVYLAGAEAGLGKRCAFPEGLYSLANIVNIVEHMLKRGFGEADVKKVMGENFLRVFDQTWRK